MRGKRRRTTTTTTTTTTRKSRGVRKNVIYISTNVAGNRRLRGKPSGGL